MLGRLMVDPGRPAKSFDREIESCYYLMKKGCILDQTWPISSAKYKLRVFQHQALFCLTPSKVAVWVRRISAQSQGAYLNGVLLKRKAWRSFRYGFLLHVQWKFQMKTTTRKKKWRGEEVTWGDETKLSDTFLRRKTLFEPDFAHGLDRRHHRHRRRIRHRRRRHHRRCRRGVSWVESPQEAVMRKRRIPVWGESFCSFVLEVNFYFMRGKVVVFLDTVGLVVLGNLSSNPFQMVASLSFLGLDCFVLQATNISSLYSFRKVACELKKDTVWIGQAWPC